MICEICNKETKRTFRCDDHHICDSCGTRKNLCYVSNGLFCIACHEQLVKKQVDAFSANTDFENEITCPWCGYVDNDSWESDDEDESECENCGNKYKYVREVEVMYSTWKIN